MLRFISVHCIFSTKCLVAVVDPEPGAPKVEIALVGDPRQLSPSVYSTEAANAGLERSWMERLLQRPVPSCDNGLSSISSTFEGNNKDDDDDNDMLGPAMVQMNDWLRYSLQREGQELSHFLTLNYRVSKARLATTEVLSIMYSHLESDCPGTLVFPDDSKCFILRRPFAKGRICRRGCGSEDRG